MAVMPVAHSFGWWAMEGKGPSGQDFPSPPQQKRPTTVTYIHSQTEEGSVSFSVQIRAGTHVFVPRLRCNGTPVGSILVSFAVKIPARPPTVVFEPWCCASVIIFRARQTKLCCNLLYLGSCIHCHDLTRIAAQSNGCAVRVTRLAWRAQIPLRRIELFRLRLAH